MPKKKKGFIDKKNAVTFRLVHRDQKDPLIVNEDAPQNVFMVPPSNPLSNTQPSDSLVEDRKAEQEKYGIYFDDDYDYLQHLKEVGELEEGSDLAAAPPPVQVKDDTKVIPLPSSMFASLVETEVGLMNKAAPDAGPKLDWDPDIVAALDDDFDFDADENQLEDDFIAIANVPDDGDGLRPAGKDDDDDGEYSSCSTDEEGTSAYNLSELRQKFFEIDQQTGTRRPMDTDTGRSRFSEYSMTSSVIRRNKELQLLDQRFEEFMADFEDEQMGSIDHEEIEGPARQMDDRLLQLAQDFHNEQLRNSRVAGQLPEKDDDGVKLACEQLVAGKKEELVDIFIDDTKPEHDCESIISTYSTLYNHPTSIMEPPNQNRKRRNTRSISSSICGEEQGLTYSQVLKETKKAAGAQQIRPRGETTEDRRNRKKIVKEMRKERRAEKKANKLAFQAELLKQNSQNSSSNVVQVS